MESGIDPTLLISAKLSRLLSKFLPMNQPLQAMLSMLHQLIKIRCATAL